MSDGGTHAKATTILSVPAGLGAFIFSGQMGTAVPAAAGCLFGLLCDPDLDQPGITRSEGRLLHGALWPIGITWFVIWYPYARTIPHRHWVSHLPIVGTFGRLAYLSLWLVGILAIIGYFFPTVETAVLGMIAAVPLEWAVWFFIGLCLADFGHWALDGMPIRR